MPCGTGREVEGIFAAPEGAASLAAYRKLRDRGFFSSDDKVVLFNTGSGSEVSGCNRSTKEAGWKTAGLAPDRGHHRPVLSSAGVSPAVREGVSPSANSRSGQACNTVRALPAHRQPAGRRRYIRT